MVGFQEVNPFIEDEYFGLKFLALESFVIQRVNQQILHRTGVMPIFDNTFGYFSNLRSLPTADFDEGRLTVGGLHGRS